jgi:hypothetical protein
LLGTLLIGIDICVYGCSLLAIIYVFLDVYKHLKTLKIQEKEQRELAVSKGDERQHLIARRLSKTQVRPKASRRESLRQEKPAQNGLTAMIAHANDHVKSKTKLFGAGLKKLVLNAHSEHKTQSAVDKAEHDHDETLHRHEQEIKKRESDAHDRLSRRLVKRKTFANTLAPKKKNEQQNSTGVKHVGSGVAPELKLKPRGGANHTSGDAVLQKKREEIKSWGVKHTSSDV